MQTLKQWCASCGNFISMNSLILEIYNYQRMYYEIKILNIQIVFLKKLVAAFYLKKDERKS
jgi:hypothetical protein